MATKGESAREKFSSFYKDDETGEEGDPKAGDDGESDDGGSAEECIANIESELAKLKASIKK
jgi:hypothetical protein